MPVILACPGSGKSYYCAHTTLWEDQDIVMKAFHKQSWHDSTHTAAEEKAHYTRLDAELSKCPKTRYIMGSLFWEYVPDAIVVIPDDILRKRVAKRTDITYAGAKRVERELLTIAAKSNVRIFDSFVKASTYIMLHR